MLRVAPRAGRALVVPAALPDGRPDASTWHAGCPSAPGAAKRTLQFFRELPRVKPWVVRSFKRHLTYILLVIVHLNNYTTM
jgi:hypothetical protein